MPCRRPRVGDVAPADRTDPPTDPRPASAGLPGLVLTGAGTDRDGERRADPDLLPALLADPATRVLATRAGRLAMSEDETRLRFRDPERQDAHRLAIYLGRARGGDALGDGGTAYVGVVEETFATDPVEGWASLRSLAVVVPPAEAALAATLTALANWHATHVRCPRCGDPTAPVQSGWVRRCASDGSDHFPRTDPAVIMAVTDADDRLLLARGTGFTTTGMSVLAGFVEPGESLAGAVAREVHEEVGIGVTDVEYVADQPWPFPTGLMIGFRARARTTALRLQESEIEAARWFTRAEFRQALDDGELHIAGRVSIARRLIEDWWGGPLDVPDAPVRR